MLAAYAARLSPDDPLSGLVVGDRPEPRVPEGWVRVHVRAAALNHHDLWSLRGVGLATDSLPRILGCDGAGEDEAGRPVLIHAVIGDPGASGDETLDPARTLLSEGYDGTLAEYVAVPARNVLPLPEELGLIEASCLPTAWLTAYRMLFTCSGARPGDTVLVQGAGGGVATAALSLGRAAGLRMWAAGRSPERLERALALGAAAVFPVGVRLPERVAAVLDTVGEATWPHSLRALRPGGTLVVSGATTGANPPAELQRLFFQQLRVVGATMGTRGELESLVRLLAQTGLRPAVDRVLPLAAAADGLAALAGGEVFGKVVLTC